jgi:hypothetical protein
VALGWFILEVSAEYVGHLLNGGVLRLIEVRNAVTNSTSASLFGIAPKCLMPSIEYAACAAMSYTPTT